MIQQENLLRVNEAAAYTGISPQRLRNTAYSGRIPHIVQYGVRLFSREALDAYIAETRPDGGAPKAGRPARPRAERV